LAIALMDHKAGDEVEVEPNKEVVRIVAID
jgi:transcription elongation GreA/GreB family factor